MASEANFIWANGLRIPILLNILLDILLDTLLDILSDILSDILPNFFPVILSDSLRADRDDCH